MGWGCDMWVGARTFGPWVERSGPQLSLGLWGHSGRRWRATRGTMARGSPFDFRGRPSLAPHAVRQFRLRPLLPAGLDGVLAARQAPHRPLVPVARRELL